MEHGLCKSRLASSMRVDSCTDISYIPYRLKSKIRPHSIILHPGYIRAFLTRIIYLGLGVAIQQDECFQALLLPIQSAYECNIT